MLAGFISARCISYLNGRAAMTSNYKLYCQTRNIVRVDPATAEWLWLWGRLNLRDLSLE